MKKFTNWIFKNDVLDIAMAVFLVTAGLLMVSLLILIIIGIATGSIWVTPECCCR